MSKTRNPPFIEHLNETYPGVDIDKAIKIIDECTSKVLNGTLLTSPKTSLELLESDLNVAILISAIHKYNETDNS